MRSSITLLLVLVSAGPYALSSCSPRSAGKAPAAQPSAAPHASSRSTIEPVTSDNWRTHPSVKESQRVAEEVTALEKEGKLTLVERPGDESCENYEGDMFRTIGRDARGRARKLTLAAGSQDSSVSVDAYYDSEVRLRFVFVKASAANDTIYEYQITFGRDGEKTWEQRTLVRGPGHTFPTPWPEEYTPRDPEARFASPTTCG